MGFPCHFQFCQMSHPNGEDEPAPWVGKAKPRNTVISLSNVHGACHTVDGRNPAPVGRQFIPGGAGFLPSTVPSAFHGAT